MHVELVAVGTELLLGQLQDTNTPYIARELAAAGIDVRATHCVGDNLERIAQTFRGVLSRANGAISTGGLGPTVDDLTKEAVCSALGVGVELYTPALEQMERFFASFGRPMPPNNRKQAELPTGSRPLPNPNGTAPGFIAVDAEGRFVACMPGVPREMKPMLRDHLVPYVRERFGATDAIYTRVLHTIGMGESDLDAAIDDLFRASVNPKIAVLAHDFRVDVKIMAKSPSAEQAQTAIAPLERQIEERLRGNVFGHDDETPASAVLRALRERDVAIAVAESCTGGRIASALTAVPGASHSFLGGVVAYDNAVKVEQLGVRAETLAAHGAVSEPVVIEMAEGARTRLHAGLGFATTGIAGPDGGSEEKPVGLIWFGLSQAGKPPRAWRFALRGDREAFLARATTMAMNLLWRYLTGQSP